jgi:hypothetical protein
MNSDAECEECRRLQNEASAAITRQLRAIARLDLARLRYESELLPSLEALLREARQTRETAVADYKRHRKAHAAGGSGEPALARAN